MFLKQFPVSVSKSILTRNLFFLNRKFSITSVSGLQELAERKTDRIFLLNELADNPGARKKGRRVGRGPGSSKGKTCGRGMKGKKAREGKKNHPWFEGGQSALFRRTPKMGFKNSEFKERFARVNVDRLITWCKLGRIDARQPITTRVLKHSGIIGKERILDGIKLLGRGSELLATSGLPPLQLEVAHCSESARKAIEGMGGGVKLVYFTALTMRAHLQPEKFDIPPKTPQLIPLKKLKRYQPYVEHHQALVERDRQRGHGGDEGASIKVHDRPEKSLPFFLRSYFKKLKHQVQSHHQTQTGTGRPEGVTGGVAATEGDVPSQKPKPTPS